MIQWLSVSLNLELKIVYRSKGPAQMFYTEQTAICSSIDTIKGFAQM